MKSESRHKRFAGDWYATPVVDVAAVLAVVTEKMERAVEPLEEGIGEAARAGGAAEVYAGSCRGTRTSVGKSPVGSTGGGLVSGPLDLG